LAAAITALASQVPYGELLACTDPAQLLNRAAEMLSQLQRAPDETPPAARPALPDVARALWELVRKAQKEVAGESNLDECKTYETLGKARAMLEALTQQPQAAPGPALPDVARALEAARDLRRHYGHGMTAGMMTIVDGIIEALTQQPQAAPGPALPDVALIRSALDLAHNLTVSGYLPTQTERDAIRGRLNAAREALAQQPQAAPPPDRGHHLAWNGAEWADERCGCRYHPDDDNGSHGGAPHVHRCEKHSRHAPVRSEEPVIIQQVREWISQAQHGHSSFWSRAKLIELLEAYDAKLGAEEVFETGTRLGGTEGAR